MLPRDAIAEALRRADRPALAAFLTAGYPRAGEFLATLEAVASAADVIEIGVPFSDPMADGVTIQRASTEAIAQGVTLGWIFEQLERRGSPPPVPALLMSYLNPLLVYGFERLAARAHETGVGGFIVPDLPFEESAELRGALDPRGLALVQMVTPATPPARLRKLCAASEGFVYAVTRAGITGGAGGLPAALAEYLDAVKAVSTLPVCAGFGVRTPEQARIIGEHADGVAVGSALVEVLERGEDPAAFLRALKGRA